MFFPFAEFGVVDEKVVYDKDSGQASFLPESDPLEEPCLQRPIDLLYALLCLVGLIAAPLAGQDNELSETVPLNADRLVVELWDADLNVLVTAGTKPVLRTEAAPQGYSIDVDLRPAAQAPAGVTTMSFRRAVVPGRENARLRVEMVVDSAQQLQVVGSGLRITLGPGQEARASAVATDETPRVELSIKDSEATLTGLRDLRVEATDSLLRLAETHGSLNLRLTTGAMEIHGHRGRLTLAATETTIEVADFDGHLEADLQGGDLRMQSGSGVWVGQTRDALLFFDGWQGELELSAQGGMFEAHGSPVRSPLWKLSGTDVVVILEEIEGPLDIDLGGGRLQARDVRGEGKTELKLSGGAEARLTDVAGDLAATVDGGVLEVDEVAKLELIAIRSHISLGGVHQLRRLDVTDSELVVDLTATVFDSSLLLQGQSDVEVSLPMPCVVQISTLSAASISQINVAGCELRLPRQRLPRRGRKLPVHQEPALVLTVTLNEESTLQAEGKR